MSWLTEQMRRATPNDRRQVTLLLLSMALYLFHITWFSLWQIEDAAITYAYARNFAAGDGFVTWAGGPWVEGFSNPTWTLLITAGIALGLDPFPLGKLLGAGFGLATLPLAWIWARRLQPHEDSLWPAIAPLALALSTQFSMWTVAGLENGVFGFLLASGSVLLLREGDRPSIGWSGIPLGLLAISRPEAPMYAGLAVLVGAFHPLRVGGFRWLASFFVLSAGPFFAWHAYSLGVFAWPVPNTYYAKLGEQKFFPWSWGQRCWSYLRSWSLNSAHILLLPAFALGQSGTRGWPARIALGMVGVLWLLLVPGLTFFHDFLPDVSFWKEPEEVMYVRVPWLVLTAGVLLVLGAARGVREGRTLAAVVVLAVFAFSIYSGGDWMRGGRWFSLCSVPLAVLLADAVRAVALAVPWARFTPDTRAFLVAAPVLLANVGQTVDVMFNVDTSPFDVRRRVLFLQGVRDRLHIDHVRHTEVDMGANLYFSGFETIDLAGLCNVPIAHNHYPVWFVDTYFQHEKTPTMAHIHGSWANKTKVYKRPWFRKDYLEIPGFGQSYFTFLHNGTYVRRDLFVEPVWDDGPRQTLFGRRLRLDDLRTPAPEVHPGGTLYVEVGWSVRRAPIPFRAVAFLHRDGRVVSFELPPAYDWLDVTKWHTQQTMIGRHTLRLPDDLEPGSWDLGIVVFTEDAFGTVQPADEAPEQALYMQGEMHWQGAIQVRSRDAVEASATIELGNAVLAARDARCEEADDHWASARRFLAPEDPWHATGRPAADKERARCWAGRALAEDDVALLTKARQLDHRDSAVHAVSQQLADRWQAEGDVAAAQGDEDGQWKGWTQALVADPTRAWLVRSVEELRERHHGAKKNE